MIPLNIRSFLDQVDELELPKVGYPYVHSDKVTELFPYVSVHDVNGFKTLQRHLAERPDVLRLVSLFPLTEPL